MLMLTLLFIFQSEKISLEFFYERRFELLENGKKCNYLK